MGVDALPYFDGRQTIRLALKNVWEDSFELLLMLIPLLI
jgi:hypothetical protein